MFRRIREMLIKEFLQMLRDPRMRAMIILMPVLQMLIFAFALTTDVAAAAPETWRGFLATGLVPATDALRLIFRAVTPPGRPRRFDARFFAARLPEGQHPDDATSETDLVRWARPADLLDEFTRGEVILMPPTIVALEQIAEHGSVDAYVAHPPVIRPVQPWPEEVDGEIVLRADLP